jgi:hypothetical protein
MILRGNQHFIDKSPSTTQLNFSWGPSMWDGPLRWGSLTPHYGDHLPLISGATNTSLWGTINPSLWGGASHHYLALWWNVLANKPHASGPTSGPTSGHVSGHAPGHALAHFTWHKSISFFDDKRELSSDSFRQCTTSTIDMIKASLFYIQYLWHNFLLIYSYKNSVSIKSCRVSAKFERREKSSMNLNFSCRKCLLINELNSLRFFLAMQ